VPCTLACDDAVTALDEARNESLMMRMLPPGEDGVGADAAVIQQHELRIDEDVAPVQPGFASTEELSRLIRPVASRLIEPASPSARER